MPFKEMRMPRTGPHRTSQKAFHGATVPAHPATSDGAGNDPNFMTSLSRGLSVIRAFSDPKVRITISHISQKTGFSRAAVRRCLYTLIKLGFAGSDDNRYFFLRPRVLTLGYSYITSMPLTTSAQSVLEHVNHVLQESGSIGALDGNEVILIARAPVTRIMSIALVVGSRLPAFCTAMGRVLLANLPAKELDAYFDHVKLTKFTERTVTSVQRLQQVLTMVRRNGYAIVDQELEMGLRSIAVPIQNQSGRVVAALNVCTHPQRVEIKDLENKFLLHLRAAAQELSMLQK
jgi:IclR family pca regulon transcriptional regulator